MSWFRIDPAAEAIIKSLQTEPERWSESDYLVQFDATPGLSVGTVVLYKDGGCLRINDPYLSVDLRSQWAMWKAYRAWKVPKQVTQEQQSRQRLMAALQAQLERGA